MSNNSAEDFGGLEAAPQPKQDAEKAKDRAAKAQARAQRLGRDERKARKHDNVLALLISSLIGDTSRTNILDAVLDALETGIPSHFLVGAVSLSDSDLSKFIRQSAGKLVQVITVEGAPVRTQFDERHIDTQLQLRMNAWFDDLVTSLFSESSVVATQKFLDLVSPLKTTSEEALESPLTDKAHPAAVMVISHTFSWFLNSINIDIAPRKAESYAAFILDEVIKRARIFLESADQELLTQGNIDLFGV